MSFDNHHLIENADEKFQESRATRVTHQRRQRRRDDGALFVGAFVKRNLFGVDDETIVTRAIAVSCARETTSENNKRASEKENKQLNDKLQQLTCPRADSHMQCSDQTLA